MSGLNILPFVTTKASDRLPQQDKVDAWFWERTAARRGYDRVVVQSQTAIQGVDQDEFVLVYRPGHPWASWGATRQGRKVMVWRCSDGAQIGLFLGMKFALDQLPSYPQPMTDRLPPF